MNTETSTSLTDGLLDFCRTKCFRTFTSRIALALQDKGYVFENGRLDEYPELGDKAWWFTWVSPTFKMWDVECGATHACWEGAVLDAFEHFMRDAHIPPVDGWESERECECDCECDDEE